MQALDPESHPQAPAASPPTGYRRIILKLSGEMIKGSTPFGLDRDAVQFLAGEIASVHALGIQLGVVIGGGNIFRGNSDAARDMKRAVADQIGMLATVINALMLQDALEHMGIQTRTMTAIPMANVAEGYIRRRAMRHLEKGRVVIFGGGTGNPFFTTDSAAALRASELDADLVMKGTKVEGIYTADPAKHPDARFLERCSYQRAIEENLGVMDAAALALCRDNELPIVVYNLRKQGNTRRVICQGDIGTKVTKE
ncbi:UMP kinase [Candidatus Poribacteria bacterium]|nr:UMP kinase [Candidatus Poribacteria bacterium]